MPTTWILPAPQQLPQDYYAKQVTAPEATPPPVTTAPVPPSAPPLVINNGGIWYGSVPPSNPSNGWLWSPGDGTLFLYMDPGVWSQVGTNW